MRLLEIVAIGISLAMDAFAVSICKGLSMKKLNVKKAIIISVYFCAFQMIMPLIGYFCGSLLETFMNKVTHWIAFVLLTIIGINMIKESFSDDENVDSNFTFKVMLPLAIATSIDALAVGITFAFLRVNILISILVIGITTFGFSFLGVKIGNVAGEKFKNKAELIGGIILILIGLKILLEHLGII